MQLHSKTIEIRLYIIIVAALVTQPPSNPAINRPSKLRRKKTKLFPRRTSLLGTFTACLRRCSNSGSPRTPDGRVKSILLIRLSPIPPANFARYRSRIFKVPRLDVAQIVLAAALSALMQPPAADSKISVILTGARPLPALGVISTNARGLTGRLAGIFDRTLDFGR